MGNINIDQQLFEKFHERTGGKREGNPTPLRGLALVFHDGRALVMVQGPCANEWSEVLSAPVTSPNGMACAVDLTQPFGLACVDFAMALGIEQPAVAPVTAIKEETR